MIICFFHTAKGECRYYVHIVHIHLPNFFTFVFRHSISKSISLPSTAYKLEVLTGDLVSAVFCFVYVFLLKRVIFGPLTNSNIAMQLCKGKNKCHRLIKVAIHKNSF